MAKHREGDVIRGFKLIEDFRMKDGANCEWTFAQKDSKQYFIKQFLAPRYPVDGAPGSAAERDRRRAECAGWEQHQNKLLKQVKAVAGEGGALVVPITLFREGSNFFKVAPRVMVEPFTVERISRLPMRDRLSIMSAVARAIQALHNSGIVHGDIASGNVLISSPEAGVYKANVIDFDNSYLVGDPPPFEQIMGNPPYYSPELLDFVQGKLDDRAKLTVRSDIFALGVLFWQYLYGSMPKFNTAFQYPCEAVRAGDVIVEPTIDRIDIHELLLSMLNLDPTGRPSLIRISDTLGKVATASPTPPPPPPPIPPKKGGLKPPKGWRRDENGKLIRDGGTTDPAPAASPEPYAGPSRVRTKIKPAEPTE